MNEERDLPKLKFTINKHRIKQCFIFKAVKSKTYRYQVVFREDKYFTLPNLNEQGEG